MNEAPPLDRAVVEAFTARTLELVREHYLTRPGPNTVLEALNGLALSLAFVIIGTETQGEERDKLRSFVIKAIDDQFVIGKPEVVGTLN